MDLGDILDDLQKDRPATTKKGIEFGRGYWDRVIKAGHVDPNAHFMQRPCPPRDGGVEHTIVLSEYEAWWLEWRLKVHLHSQKMLEWIELEEVIGCLLTRISSLSMPLRLIEDNSSIVVGESLKESSTSLVTSEPDSGSSILDATSVQPKQPGTVMETAPITLETSLISTDES